MDLQFIVREPENITPNSQLLVMIHGYGSNEEDLFSFRHDLPEDWIIVSYRAPKMTDYNGFSWYDIDFNDAEKFIDVEQAVDSMKAIMKSIDNLKHHYQLEGKTNMMGFSQGGILTYAMTLTYPEFFNKIACLSAYPEPKILKNIKAMIAHKIGGMTVFSTANLILSKFVGLTAVGLYSNYYLVIATSNSFAGQFFAAITASIGNLIVLERNQKKVDIFKVTEFIVAWQALIIVCGFFTLLNPLIELWLGKQFLFDEVVVTWLIINFYLTYMRMAVNAFKDASGLYWNDRYKPLAESVINLIASVYLTIH